MGGEFLRRSAVLVHLLILLPVGLALGLLMFGRYGRRSVQPTGGRVALTTAAAILAGPVAVEALGFFLWLVAVIAIVVTGAIVAAMRTPPPGRHA